MNHDGILFDLDGTLWEVMNETYHSANIVTKKYNMDEIPLNKICSTFGFNSLETAKSYFPNLDIKTALKISAEISEVNIDYLQKNGGHLYPHLEDTLKNLSYNYSLFIVSNSGHTQYIEAFLNSSGLSKYFKDYIAASALNLTKADAILKIKKDYDLKKAIYIGDTKKDLEATLVAKVPFIHARYGFCKNLDTKYYIDSLKDLPDEIKKIYLTLEWFSF